MDLASSSTDPGPLLVGLVHSPDDGASARPRPRRRLLPTLAVMLAVAVGLTGIGVAVQQRQVAGQWRTLEREQTAAAGQQISALRQQAKAAATGKAEVQAQLTALAARSAKQGDLTAEITFLAAKGRTASGGLDACLSTEVGGDLGTFGTGSADDCATAVARARAVLSALASSGTGG